MIPALLITIVVEGTLASAYSIWQEKPVGLVLLTCILGNLITQSFLWIALSLFIWHYIVTLLVGEFFIWMVEGFFLCGVRFNRLNLGESLRLSFVLNLVSFTLGWLLPV